MAHGQATHRHRLRDRQGRGRPGSAHRVPRGAGPGATAQEVLAWTNEKAQAAIAAFSAGGVEPRDIATANVTMWPEYGEDRRRVEGYQAQNTLSVRLRDIAAAGGLLDTVAGVIGDEIVINGLSFAISDTEPVLESARSAAMTAACWQGAAARPLRGCQGRQGADDHGGRPGRTRLPEGPHGHRGRGHAHRGRGAGTERDRDGHVRLPTDQSLPGPPPRAPLPRRRLPGAPLSVHVRLLGDHMVSDLRT